MNSNDSLEIVIIAAVADNGVIGDNGELPWYYPEDLKHFRRITVCHSVIMGRKTFDSIEERPGGELPKRRNIVLTRQGVSLDQSRVIEARSVDQAVEQAGNKGEQRAYVIGGQSIYEQFLNRGIVDRLLITLSFER
jgi:dihydrofolate reductase